LVAVLGEIVGDDHDPRHPVLDRRRHELGGILRPAVGAEELRPAVKIDRLETGFHEFGEFGIFVVRIETGHASILEQCRRLVQRNALLFRDPLNRA